MGEGAWRFGALERNYYIKSVKCLRNCDIVAVKSAFVREAACCMPLTKPEADVDTSGKIESRSGVRGAWSL